MKQESKIQSILDFRIDKILFKISSSQQQPSSQPWRCILSSTRPTNFRSSIRLNEARVYFVDSRAEEARERVASRLNRNKPERDELYERDALAGARFSRRAITPEPATCSKEFLQRAIKRSITM